MADPPDPFFLESSPPFQEFPSLIRAAQGSDDEMELFDRTLSSIAESVRGGSLREIAALVETAASFPLGWSRILCRPLFAWRSLDHGGAFSRPLFEAASAGRLDAMALLVQNPDFAIPSLLSSAAMECATERRLPAFLFLSHLLEPLLDPSRPTLWSPLALCCSVNFHQGAAALLAHGDPRAACSRTSLRAAPSEAAEGQAALLGLTPLMVAAKRGSRECVELVLPWSDPRAVGVDRWAAGPGQPMAAAAHAASHGFSDLAALIESRALAAAERQALELAAGPAREGRPRSL